MALQDVKPGKYIGRPIEGIWAASQQKGTPYAAILFEFEADGEKNKIWHRIFFTDTALKDGSTVADKGFELLVCMGYDEDASVGENEKFSLDTTKEFELVIEINDRGMRQVKYCNRPRINSAMSVDKLFNGGIKEKMAAARARLGMGKTAF